MENAKDLVMTYGQLIIVGLVVLFIGFKISNIIVKMFSKALDKNNVDPSLKPFLTSVLSWLIKVAVVIAAANTAGIKTTSFIAILGTAGLAIGMALQGSLSNFAGGVVILILKPFKVGDFIKAQGFIGSVQKITTFSTFLKTPDNQIICLPNGVLANSPIVNVNQESTRRVDFTFGIGYNDNIDLAKSVLKNALEADSRILKDPTYAIFVGELADSSVNIVVRAWAKTEDYWAIYSDMLERVKKDFDREKISIPYPQKDIYVHNVQ